MSKPLLNIETIGQGPDIVMLHGWGMNAGIFTSLHPYLSQYRVHYVDLPGFGYSSWNTQESTSLSASEIAQQQLSAWVEQLLNSLPSNAIWIGWSLGGLIATEIALRYPDRVKALVTIASSPCFMARETEKWLGIPPQVLTQFSSQLEKNLKKTIERFLAIQALGSPSSKEDIKQIKELVLERPLPNIQALAIGLKLLTEIDLRVQLQQIDKPWLRMWGKLDGLVPKGVVKQMPKQVNIKDIIFPKASHAPFISHQADFVSELTQWLDSLN